MDAFKRPKSIRTTTIKKHCYISFLAKHKCTISNTEYVRSMLSYVFNLNLKSEFRISKYYFILWLRNILNYIFWFRMRTNIPPEKDSLEIQTVFYTLYVSLHCSTLFWSLRSSFLRIPDQSWSSISEMFSGVCRIYIFLVKDFNLL